MDYFAELKRIIGLFPERSHRNLRYNMWTVRTIVAVRRLKHLHRIIAESFIEANLYMWCELVRTVMAVEVQPFTVHFEFEGKLRRYTPDALVLTRFKAFIIECKPAREYFTAEFQAFVVAARAYFASFGLDYVVIDEMDVGGWSLQTNLTLLWRAQSSPELLTQARAIEDWLGEAATRAPDGSLTVKECLGRGANLFAVHCALANGQAYADLHKPIIGTTRLRADWGNAPGEVLSKLRAQPDVAILAAPALPSIWQAAPPLPGRPVGQVLQPSASIPPLMPTSNALNTEEVAS